MAFKTPACVLSFGLSASLSYGVYTVAPYTGSSWTKVWDFNDGRQGWTTVVAGNGTAAWSSHYGGSMYFSCPGGSTDRAYAEFDLAPLGPPFNNLGEPDYGHNGFVLQCDVYIPANPGYPTGAHPGVLQGQTLSAVRRADHKGPSVGGGQGSSYGAQAQNRAWDGSSTRLGYTFGYQGQVVTEQALTLQLSYGYVGGTNQWNAWVYNPLPNDRDPAGGWMQVISKSTAAMSNVYEILSIGANGYNGQTPWGEAYFDNVKLLTPEPGTIALLAVAAAFVIRRPAGRSPSQL